MGSGNWETREAARLQEKHGAKNTRCADKRTHHLTDQSCRKTSRCLLVASTLSDKAARLSATQSFPVALAEEEGKQLCLPARHGTCKHANKHGLHLRCTRVYKQPCVNEALSITPTSARRRFLCIRLMLKHKGTERIGESFFRPFGAR